MAAAAPTITSVGKAGKKKEEVMPVTPFPFSRKSEVFPGLQQTSIYISSARLWHEAAEESGKVKF